MTGPQETSTLETFNTVSAIMEIIPRDASSGVAALINFMPERSRRERMPTNIATAPADRPTP